MNNITHDRLQQQCFMWHWNNFKQERGRLWMNYNNPKSRAHGAILKGMGLLSGVADMTYLRSDGRSVFIEFKVGTDRQSGKQKEWERVVSSCGCVYQIVSDENQFQEVIKHHSEHATATAH